jgi:hypothetical protein
LVHVRWIRKDGLRRSRGSLRLRKRPKGDERTNPSLSARPTPIRKMMPGLFDIDEDQYQGMATDEM